MLTPRIFALLLLGMSYLPVAHADNLKEIVQLANSGQATQALERLDTHIRANPKDAQAIFTRGVILAEVGKRDEAIKSFVSVTEMHPNLPEPYNNLAVLYADQGQYDKAKKALETAIKTHPSYATAHENLGDVYARQASEAYDKALQLDNSNSRAQNKLSMIKGLFNGSYKPVIVGNKEQKPAEPAAKPAETAKPAEPAATPTPAAPAADSADPAVVAAVNAWAAAWASQNVDGYLASYASSFKTPKGEARSDWENLRRERISKPAKISVDLSNIKVKMDGDKARVSFQQSYRGGGLAQRTSKTLFMVNSGGKWLIEQEIADN
ncbi:tetratricopeptide repeat protein [Pseudomethylobacillus aquaticus]|uniref:Tetratricopeptide repeat protein n=1 Tax=Pseudomethylobacillus aquaticus TaxID=2676064 RepID=A0A3N0V0D6_9PROT|nr:tetratricopeptide repeat protein [Pseudomethylobacillus aquaticus]ROH86220.1 tetratricopeptide repeat protein [Pseudomethylobacillus aquaticus]